jgi:hypothetical protein
MYVNLLIRSEMRGISGAMSLQSLYLATLGGLLQLCVFSPDDPDPPTKDDGSRHVLRLLI